MFSLGRIDSYVSLIIDIKCLGLEVATTTSPCTSKEALQTQAKNVRSQNQELDLTLPQVCKLANKLPKGRGGKYIE